MTAIQLRTREAVLKIAAWQLGGAGEPRREQRREV